MPPSSPPGLSGTLLAIQTGRVRPLMVGGRKLVSAIGKTTVSGPIDVAALASAPSAAPAEPATLAVRAENERISQLESDSVALRSELAELRQQFAEFRKQFE